MLRANADEQVLAAVGEFGVGYAAIPTSFFEALDQINKLPLRALADQLLSFRQARAESNVR